MWLVLYGLTTGHSCMHHTLPAHTAVVVPQRRAPRRRSLADAELPGLRIVFDTSTLDDDDPRTCYAPGGVVSVGAPARSSDVCAPSGAAAAGRSADCHFSCLESNVLTAAKRAALSERLLPVVADWFKQALRVRAPVEGPLPVANSPCRFSGDVAMPPAVVGGGAADADVFIVVTARPIPQSTIAYAGHCQESGGSASPYAPHRPTVGQVNIDPDSLEALVGAGARDEETVDGVLKVLVHEVMHVLGMTYEKMAQFACPEAAGYSRFVSESALYYGAGGPRDCAAAGSPNPIVERVRFGQDGARHVSRRLATPRVVQVSR